VGPRPKALHLLYLIFFLSGASGLIYQVVWVREFGNVFGNTIHSASLVIAVFMCGLGVGSYLAGRWADRRYVERPGSLLVAYGRVELVIAALGLLVTLLLPRLGELSAATSSYTRDANGWYVLSLGSYLTRYAVAVVLLAPITMLMGSTLTLLIRHLVRHDVSVAGWRIGALYGVNTAGAALGAFLTDYALIPHVGLMATQMTAVLFNVLAGYGALRLAVGSTPPASAPLAAEPAEPTRATPAVAFVGLGIFVSGFVALGMEILWFRHLSSLFGSYRAVLSFILTIVLVGIWLGALAGGWIQRRFGRPLLYYMATQALFVVGAMAGIAAADVNRVYATQAALFETFVAAAPWKREVLQLWLSFRAVLWEVAVPALLMGFSYPLANAAVQDTERAVGRRAGLLYLANTLGAVAGSLVTGFVLLPWLGMQQTMTALAATAAVGLLPLYAAARGASIGRPRRWMATAAAVAAVAAVTVGLALWLRLPRQHVIRVVLPPQGQGGRVVALSEGLTEVIAILEVPSDGRLLVTNGHPMSATSLPVQRYMRAFAHVPLLALEAPERVLVICFGVGNTAHAASLHPSVSRVDVVDTSRHVLGHARFFAGTNGDILRNPKIAVHVNDGRHHLRMRRPGTYDLITLEPPPIAFAGVASLYSREFYALARSRLKPGGYMTQWLPAYQLPNDAVLAMVRAFVDVFPRSVLLSGSFKELILVGVNGPRLEIDPDRVQAHLDAAPAVLADLRRVNLGSVTEIVATFAAPGTTLDEVSAPYPAVTDDYPITEYAVHSRLNVHHLPAALFNVAAVTSWCPKCFVNGRPIRGLEQLPAHLAIFHEMYMDPVFLESYWPHPPANRNAPMRVRFGGDRAAAVASSSYLQALAGLSAPPR
jgi:predicted membrane-bound spermidine synthase